MRINHKGPVLIELGKAIIGIERRDNAYALFITPAGTKTHVGRISIRDDGEVHYIPNRYDLGATTIKVTI